MAKPKWNVDKNFKDYVSGCSLKSIARKNGIHYSTVRTAFKRVFGVRYLIIARGRLPKRALTERLIESLFKEYKDGKSVYRIAREQHIKEDILYYHFLKINEYKRISSGRIELRKVSSGAVRRAWHDYVRGDSLYELSRKYDMSRSSLTKNFRMLYGDGYKAKSKSHRLDASFINVKSAIKRNQKIKEEDVKSMIAMRDSGKTIYEIASNFDITPPTVTLYLKKYGNFIPFDRAKYISSKGIVGEKIVEIFLSFLEVPYESQKVLANRCKPDFLISKSIFVEVKSRFLTLNDFYEIRKKYLVGGGLSGGVIIAFYGYSRDVMNVAKDSNIIVWNGNAIKNYFSEIGATNLSRDVDNFMRLNYRRWQLNDAKYLKQDSVDHSKIHQEFKD